MNVRATTETAASTGADTVVVGLFDGEAVAHDVEDGTLQALVDSGEAKSRTGHLAVTHAAGVRWILVGLGKRDDFTAERARVAAAKARSRAAELSSRVLCWELPHDVGDAIAAAIVEGTLMADYRFDRYRKAPEDEPPRIGDLVLSDHDDRSEAVAGAVVVAEAVNAARDLQNAPANDMTPAKLGERAQELARQIEGL